MECALACQATYGCEYFIYGNGRDQGECYWEHTTRSASGVCPEGWDEDNFDLYRLDEFKGIAKEMIIQDLQINFDDYSRICKS